MRARLVASGLFVSLLVLTGCARAAVSPSSIPPSPAPANGTGSGDRIYLREAFGLAIIDAASGTRERVLPVGVPSPDWSTLYTADVMAGKTRVRAISVATGQTLREASLDGQYRLPSFSGAPAGLSPNGSWMTLYAADRAKSRYAVLDTAFANAPRRAELNGDFGFDAVSNDGKLLFLIQYVGQDDPSQYQVRAYDLAGGFMRPQLVVDKRGGQPIMQGTRQATVSSPDGQWLYSLYLNAGKGPFIHALNVGAAVAFCIFLPRVDGVHGDKDFMWSLAMTPDGSRLFAANGPLGAAAEIDARRLTVSRSTLSLGKSAQAGPLTRIANWIASPAEAKRPAAEATLTPDGRTLLMPVERGVLAVDTSNFSLRGRYLTEQVVESLAVSPDGERLYAVSAGAARVLKIDLASGAAVTTVPGPVNPIAVLRVESRTSP